MILTPVIIMRMLFRRSLECIKILVKKRRFCTTFTCPCNIVLHAFGLDFTTNAISPLRNAHFFAGRGPPRLFYRSPGCRFCLGGGARSRQLRIRRKCRTKVSGTFSTDSAVPRWRQLQIRRKCRNQGFRNHHHRHHHGGGATKLYAELSLKTRRVQFWGRGRVMIRC